MERKIVVCMPALTEKHRSALREAAERGGFEIHICDNAAEARPMMREAEALLSDNESLLKDAPMLRWVHSYSSGVNQFLAPGVLPASGVTLTNSSGAYGVTISEHILMQLLNVLRRRQEFLALLARREWRHDLPLRSIYGSRVTLLGTGDIGQETLKRLRAFEPAQLIGINRSGKNPGGLFDAVFAVERLSDVLPQTDILILSLPGTPKTYHILNEETLALLPDGAVVINVGRGSLIDEAALEKELLRGRLFAALDVFEQEPLPPASTLWDCPNLLISPHSAGFTTLPHTVDRIVELFIENLGRYATGQPFIRPVDPAKGY